MTDPTPSPGTATPGSGRHRRPGRLDLRALVRGGRPGRAPTEPGPPLTARTTAPGSGEPEPAHPVTEPVRQVPQVERIGHVSGPSASGFSRDESRPYEPSADQPRPDEPGPPSRPTWDGPLPAWTGPASPRSAADAPRPLTLPPTVGPRSGAVVPSPRPAGGHPRAAPDLAEPPPGPWARLAFSDGRTVLVTGSVLVGRDPTPRMGESPGTLVAVPDPGRSVSKTHLGVGVDDFGAWVVDRRSTNGTVVTLPDGQRILCVPERRVRLTSGSSVAFGDHGFTLTTDPR